MTLADLGARLLERPLVVREPFQALDAIVVLGSPLGPGDSLTPVLGERAAAAAALWRAGGAPLVVTSGGVTRGSGRAEADVLAEAVRAAGVPEVLIENRSLTTRENARFTWELLRERDARSVWLVTQPLHGRRAARLFRAVGFAAHAWHIDDSLQYRDRTKALRWLVREYAAWAALLVGGGR